MIIEIEEGLSLNNPTMEIINISYPQKTKEVIVECCFKEENSTFPHSRSYVFLNESGEQLTKPDVLELMKTNKVLKQFINNV